jgi:hypothetical protein
LQIYDLEGKPLGPLHDNLFYQTEAPWNDGFHLDFLICGAPVLIADPNCPGGFREIMLKANFALRTEAWQGTCKLLKGRGLYDCVRSSATISSAASVYESIDVSTLRGNPNWHRILWTREEDLFDKIIFRYTGVSQDLCPPHVC